MKLKMKNKLIAIVMSLAMAFAMMPIIGAPVYADDPAPAAPGIALGSDVLGIGSNTSGAATVHMAGTKWRVIGYGASQEGGITQVASSADTMTLIAADNLKTGVQFRADGQASDANHYGKSNLKNEIEALTDEDNGIFSKGEKEGIVPRDLKSAAYTSSPPYTNGIAGDEVQNALLWPLSTQESYYMNGALRPSGDSWWLRSQSSQNSLAANVSANGVTNRATSVNLTNGVRPAFNFNLESVILTSAAAGGKSSGDVGAGSLKSVEPNSNNEWKLTLESGHDNFEVENVSTCDGKTVNIKYSGAVAKKDEYISAIITDEKDAVKYYGNLIEFANGDSASGTASLTIDGKMESTDKLYVINEQLNGDNKTDYASELIEITVPTATGHIYMWAYVNDANHKGVCDKCGGEITEEHTYQEGRCTVCNGACGHSSLNDSYSHDLYIHWKTCAYCGNAIEHEEHAWQDEWTADGTKHWHECEVCQRKKDEENHKWDAGKVTTPPTTQTPGVKTITCTVCKATKTEPIAKLHSGTPLVRMTTKGDNSLVVSWNKIQGADGYDVYFAYCGETSKYATTIKGNKTFSWTKSGLKKGRCYKAYVKAYVLRNGKKVFVKCSPLVHAYASGGSTIYTSAKAVKVEKTSANLKAGQAFQIKPSIEKLNKNKYLMPKKFAPTFRYMSSNENVATVSSGGKVTAKGKGSCYIYVYAHNGVSKQVKVTVK